MFNNYIKNALIYWDPWWLINGSSAPENEYDSYVPKIAQLVEDARLDSSLIKRGLEEIFSDSDMPKDNLERAIKGITEGLVYYLNH